MEQRQRDSIERVRMKSIIGAEYVLNVHPDCAKLGLVGKTARLLKESEIPGVFYVMVEEQVYRLSRVCWDLNITSGLLDVNMTEVVNYLSSNEIDVVLVETTVQMLASVYSQYFKVSEELLQSQHPITVLTLNFNRGILKKKIEPSRFTIKEKGILALGNGESYVAVYSDNRTLAGRIYRRHGIHVSDVLRIVTMLELQLCMACESNHQTIIEDEGSFSLHCADCGDKIYHQSSNQPSKLSPQLLKQISRAQSRIAKYYSLRKTTRAATKE